MEKKIFIPITELNYRKILQQLKNKLFFKKNWYAENRK